MGVFDEKPDRMSIGNLATGDTVEMQYNPTDLAEEVGVNYQKTTIFGMSHQLLQYVHTENHGFSFELAFDALAQVGPNSYDALAARRFLLALCYPRRGASDIRGGAPPRSLFVWPKLVSMTCVITKLKNKFTRFARDGTPTAFVSAVTIEEIRDARLFSEDVAAYGTIRSNVAAEG